MGAFPSLSFKSLEEKGQANHHSAVSAGHHEREGAVGAYSREHLAIWEVRSALNKEVRTEGWIAVSRVSEKRGRKGRGGGREGERAGGILAEEGWKQISRTGDGREHDQFEEV